MIVKQHIKGWEIISHYTHGLLAGKLAMQLKHSLRPHYWEEVLTAIIEHDDHLLDFNEKNYLTDIGTLLDFMLDNRSDDADLRHAERVYENANLKSQLVALLIGKHLEYVYRDKAQGHEGFKTFFKKLCTDRKIQAKLYGWGKENIESSYDLMLFCDRCSLILSQGLVPTVGQKLEINRTIKDEDYFIFDRNGMLCIDPWPFESEEFKLHYEFRVVTQPSFTTNAELSHALSKATVTLRNLAFHK